jgi:capsular exopolysaccharide synthesis family protein
LVRQLAREFIDMTTRGRIHEAIDKAREERGKHHPHAAKRPAKSGMQGRIVNQPMPAFPEVPYDRSRCSSNRLLISDSTSTSDSSDAPYRVLRTRLLLRARANNWAIIGVTSPGQGEGKSLTALNLALSIAREGNNDVFLIDFDMRRPKICDYLGASSPLDINEFLAGAGTPQEVLFSIGIPNLTFAGSMKNCDQASELLASSRVEELLGYILSVAPRPLIITDLPPLLSTDDALIVAPKVDACLLVLAEGKTRRDSASKALELMSEFELAGIVLNRSTAMQEDYYSY